MKIKYYTDTIPPTLAEKLKERGMPMNLWKGVGKYMEQLEETVEMRDGFYLGTFKNTILYQLPTYAEVFDWLMSEKEMYIRILPFFATSFTVVSWGWSYHIDRLHEPSFDTKLGFKDWQEAANEAIEKALELIKDKLLENAIAEYK